MFIHFNYRVFFAQYTLKDETIWTSWIVKYNCLIQHHSKSPYIFIIILSALKNGVIDCGTRQQWTSTHFDNLTDFLGSFVCKSYTKYFSFSFFICFIRFFFGNILCIPFSVRFRIIEKIEENSFLEKTGIVRWNCILLQ